MALQVGELYAKLVLDKTKFGSGLKSAEGSFNSFGSKMGGAFKAAAKVAAVALTAVAVAVAAIAIKSVEAAVRFESAMDLIRTQAGATTEELEFMSAAVLDLAPAVGTGPEELAKGLYHIESAGIRGAKGLDVLKTAALGAKVGNADLEAVTNALIAEVNSGIGGVNGMSEAMGVLNGIVGSGNMRMNDLADALATGILSVAKTFGVKIQSVGAAIATMTDQGIPASRAATMLKMAIVKLAAPSAKGAKLLKEIGIGELDLAKALRGKDGLHGALTILKTKMDEAGLSATQQAKLMADAFGGGKTGPGIMLLVSSLDKLHAKEVLIGQAATGFGQAVAWTMEDADFKAAQVRASFDSIAVVLGNVLLPAAAAAFGGIAAWLGSPEFKQGIQDLGEGIGWVAENVFPEVGKVVKWVTDRVIPALVKAFQWVANNVLPVLVRALRWVADNVLPAVGKAFDQVVDGIAKVIAVLRPFIDAIQKVGGVLLDFLSRGDNMTTLLKALGIVVAAAVVPPFLAWAAATVIALAPIIALGVAVFAVIKILDDLGLLGPIIEAVTRGLGLAFQWVVDNVLPALGAAFQWIVDNVLPALSAAFSWVVANVVPALGAAFNWIVTDILPAVGAVFGWIADNVLPPMMSIIQVISDVILPALGAAFEGVVSWVRANLPTIRAVFEQVMSGIRTAAGIIGTVVKAAFNIIAGIINTVAPIIVKVGSVIFPALGTAASILLGAIKVAFDAIGAVWNAALEIVRSCANSMGNVWTGLKNIIGGVWGAIVGTIKGGANIVIGIINGIISAINAIQIHVHLDFPWGGGFGFDWNGLRIPHIPYLAKGTPFFEGGWAVLGERGPELARLPRGTQVLPADRTAAALGGTGGVGGKSETNITQNVYGIHPDDVERQTLRALRRARLSAALQGTS